MKIAFNPALACIGMIGLLLTTAILAADGSVPPTLTNEHKAIDLRLEVNDLVFQVRDYPREGEAIVFLHYTGGNMMSWARAVPHFTQDYRVVLIDLRGHGKSSTPNTGYHLDKMASDVWGVMQQMGLEQAHFVGSSMGAEVALSMAANHPDKVLSLVLEGALVSQLGPYSEQQTSTKRTKARIEEASLAVKDKSGVSFATIDELLDSKKTNAPNWNRYMEAAERYGAHQLTDGRYGATMGIKQWLSYIKHSVPIRYEEYFKDVECPVLLFSGMADFGSTETVSLQRSLLDLATPKGELLVLDNWSHTESWLANPEDGIRAVKTLLGTVGSESD